jgi:hypothetical protein
MTLLQNQTPEGEVVEQNDERDGGKAARDATEPAELPFEQRAQRERGDGDPAQGDEPAELPVQRALPAARRLFRLRQQRLTSR